MPFKIFNDLTEFRFAYPIFAILLNAAIFLIYRESIVLQSEINNVRGMSEEAKRKAILILGVVWFQFNSPGVATK